MRKSTSSVSLQMFLTTFQTVDQRLSWFQSEIKQKIKFKTFLQLKGYSIYRVVSKIESKFHNSYTINKTYRQTDGADNMRK